MITEIALACVLLVGAGLLLRSFLRILDVSCCAWLLSLPAISPRAARQESSRWRRSGMSERICDWKTGARSFLSAASLEHSWFANFQTRDRCDKSQIANLKFKMP